MGLPPDLLEAVSNPGGGKITLVVGAGCSFEAPTSIPLASQCSVECHDRLVADGVLTTSDCPNPSNLSCLADTVVKKTRNQRALVRQLLEHYSLKAATPNEGHKLTAALLSEGAIASVVTLNFDLALSTAIGMLGVGERIAIIDGPDDLPNQRIFNLYYLHRNANASDPDKWILRTEAIKSEWRDSWEKIVAAKVLATPVVVFAGLGSPADVLIESIKLIQRAIPNGSKAYQVDPGDPNNSQFFKALGLDPNAFIQEKWCNFMVFLSQRLVLAHVTSLRVAAEGIATREHLHQENIDVLLDRVLELGLLHLGGLRSSWLLQDKPYCPDVLMSRELIAEILLSIAMLGRISDATAILSDDGIVEFQRVGRTVASLIFASGGGARNLSAIEGRLSSWRRRYRGRASPPTAVIVAGTPGGGELPITLPFDVVNGDSSKSILDSELPIFIVDQFRGDPAAFRSIVP